MVLMFRVSFDETRDKMFRKIRVFTSAEDFCDLSFFYFFLIQGESGGFGVVEASSFLADPDFWAD